MKHHHRCPYCKRIYECLENCYSGHLNNRVCPTCKATLEKELTTVVKEHGTEWHEDILW